MCSQLDLSQKRLGHFQFHFGKMSNPFSSAFNYLSGHGDVGGNKMVGQTVDLGGGSKLKIKKVIAEGEWAKEP